MPHLRKPASTLLILLWLTACGGGDGDPGSKGPNLSGNPGGGSLLDVEGLWTGQSNDGVQTALIVLEDGSAWGLQRRGSVPASAIVGKASGSGGVFSMPASVLNLGIGPPPTARTPEPTPPAAASRPRPPATRPWHCLTKAPTKAPLRCPP